MKSRHIVVEVLPDHIGLFVYEGERCVVDERLEIEPQDDALEWAKLLRRSAVTLQSIVDRLKIEGLETRVLYRSPTQSVDLVNFAVSSPAQAVEAAILSCADSLPYSAMSAVTEAFVLGRDAAGDSKQTHVVVAAEREDVAESVVYMIKEAGLTFVSATPFDAAVMANFIAEELCEKKVTRATLYMGRYASFFVVTQGGTLLFNRRIDLGVDAIEASLTRPLNVPGRSETLELSIHDARRLIEQFGIPGRDVVVDDSNALKGGHIIPLMQPVLQRFVVELRQSLRFGVPESVREGLSLYVTGPGSAVKGLYALIGQELSIETTGDDRYDVSGHGGNARTELDDALDETSFLDRLNLMPRAMATTRRTSRLRRWLLTGSAAAIALIAGDGYRQHSQLEELRDQAAVYEAQLADVEALKVTGDRLRVLIGAKNQLETTIAREAGTSIDLRACMHELSRITPGTIRLSTMRFSRQGENTVGGLTGYAFEKEAAGGNDLEPYIESLRKSPLFKEVVLGHVRMGAAGGRRGQSFETSFRAVSAPRHGTQIAKAEGEAP